MLLKCSPVKFRSVLTCELSATKIHWHIWLTVCFFHSALCNFCNFMSLQKFSISFYHTLRDVLLVLSFWVFQYLHTSFSKLCLSSLKTQQLYYVDILYSIKIVILGMHWFPTNTVCWWTWFKYSEDQ